MKTIIFTFFFVGLIASSQSFQLVARDIGGPSGEIVTQNQIDDEIGC